jgi:hypothetical protein
MAAHGAGWGSLTLIADLARLARAVGLGGGRRGVRSISSYLLCTDGLTDMVAEPSIAEVLQRGDTAADACAALVEQALERGGKDNVTVVLARYHFLD